MADDISGLRIDKTKKNKRRGLIRKGQSLFYIYLEFPDIR